ncbi:MAG TPA: alpha/beta hydrolase-fold protein [Vicinamibacteria bacterium]|nr:alpha/beta hydrolase-fold protein [Vicinamibacteria bacterium]
MKKHPVLAICFAVALTATVTTGVNVYLHERPSLGKSVVPRTMDSKLLGEPREMLVHLPESYHRKPGQRYPVVYVLDGSSVDVHTAHSAALMARIGVMPEVIVVGLPNTSGANRQRDYTPPFIRRDIDKSDSPPGAGDRFIAFLRSEVMPWIEREYRTASFRVLVGHSRGGLLAVYSLIADPGLFDARIALSPALWRDDQVMVSKLRETLLSRADLDSFLYMSMGSQENEKMMAAYRSAVTTLRQHAPRGLRWSADLTEGATHATNAETSAPVGFRTLYRGWQPDQEQPPD